MNEEPAAMEECLLREGEEVTLGLQRLVAELAELNALLADYREWHLRQRIRRLGEFYHWCFSYPDGMRAQWIYYLRADVLRRGHTWL